MKKNPELTEVTRRSIQDAFWTLYQEKPLEQITVKQITDLAGYNRSTFYQYYRDVYDVLDQIEVQVFQNMEVLANLVYTQAEKMSLTDLVSAFMEHHQNKQHYLKILLGKHGDRDFERRLVEWNKTLFGSLVYWEGIDPMLQDWFLEYHINGIIGVLKCIIRQGQELTTEQMVSVLTVITGQSAEELSHATLASVMKWPKQLKTVEKPGIINESSNSMTGGQTND